MLVPRSSIQCTGGRMPLIIGFSKDLPGLWSIRGRKSFYPSPDVFEIYIFLFPDFFCICLFSSSTNLRKLLYFELMLRFSTGYRRNTSACRRFDEEGHQGETCDQLHACITCNVLSHHSLCTNAVCFIFKRFEKKTVIRFNCIHTQHGQQPCATHHHHVKHTNHKGQLKRSYFSPKFQKQLPLLGIFALHFFLYFDWLLFFPSVEEQLKHTFSRFGEMLDVKMKNNFIQAVVWLFFLYVFL